MRTESQWERERERETHIHTCVPEAIIHPDRNVLHIHNTQLYMRSRRKAAYLSHPIRVPRSRPLLVVNCSPFVCERPHARLNRPRSECATHHKRRVFGSDVEQEAPREDRRRVTLAGLRLPNVSALSCSALKDNHATKSPLINLLRFPCERSRVRFHPVMLALAKRGETMKERTSRHKP